MLAKSLFVAAFFALTSVTVATPPGCLLGAVNTYSDPSDIKSVCSAKDVSSTIAKYCTGDSTKSALSAFADICNGAGVKVSTDVPTSSGSASASATPSASMSGYKSSVTPYVSGSMTIYPSGYNMTVPTATGGPKATGTLGPKASGTAGAGAASGTSTGGPAQSTGAAGRIEIGVAAALLGLFAIAL